MASHNNLIDLTASPNRHISTSSPMEYNKRMDFANLRQWEDLETSAKTRGIAFRLMSYNILAQILLEFHSYLYSQCSQENLEWKTRKSRMHREIIAQNPDIVCLQELQHSHVEEFDTLLKKSGYKYVYKRRTGVRVDGCAIFYKSTVFDVVENRSVEFRQPSTDILDRDNIGLMAKFRLRAAPATMFVVATTHLLYNPKRMDVRLAQVQLFLAEIDRFAFHTEESGMTKTQRLPVVITGDLNSEPRSPVVRLLADGRVDFQQRLSGLKNIAVTDLCQHLGVYLSRSKGVDIENEDQTLLYHSERDEEGTIKTETSYHESVSYESFFNRGRIKHRLDLKSVYDFERDGTKEVTSHHDDWVTIDYIFYASGTATRLEAIERYRLPTEDECDAMGAIPNQYFGSDHFSLAAGFAIYPRVPPPSSV